MKNYCIKDKKGITLVALVVTIVVLLILAGVSINLILGDNGIVKKEQEAREKTEEAKANEEKDFADWTDSIDKILDDNQDDNVENKMAKYFTYTVNEDTKEATVTGVKAEYSKYCYYNSSKIGVSAIVDGENEITDIIIPKEINDNGEKYTVTKIGDSMLSCGISEVGTGDFNNLVLPDTITEIGERAFSSQKIKNIVFSANLKKIGDYAFAYNDITNINLPDKLESIGEEAFFSYKKGREVKIPKSVSVIGNKAFYSNDTIYCEIAQKPDGWVSNWYGNATVYWNQTL